MFKAHDAFYINPEPRVSLNYSFDKIGTFSASYTVMSKYNHALSKNEQLMRNLVWVPATSQYKPEKSYQYSLGYLKSLFRNEYSFQTHIYFKTMKDLVFFCHLIRIVILPTDGKKNYWVAERGKVMDGKLCLKKIEVNSLEI